MPIDKRRESKLIAVICADVFGAGDAEIGRCLRPDTAAPWKKRTRPSPPT